ncbi:MAG TPA: DUF6338 family protein [Actinomycetota bacterium]|nr:DUF6338 family protein [Actinomycetota bacterium]
MPTTFLGLLIFVAFLAPGFVFVLIREQRRPSPERSVFRETALFLLSGLLGNILALLLFGLARTKFPNRTPDVGQLIRQPGPYAEGHYLELAWWSLGFLVLSCVTAIVLAHQDPRKWRLISFLGNRKFLSFLGGSISVDSAWEVVFNSEAIAETEKHCGCLLEDGTWISGVLASSSPDPRETGDRELVLAPPIYWRAAGDETVVESDAQRVVISARRLVVLDVRYYAPQEESAGLTANPRPAPLAGDLGSQSASVVEGAHLTPPRPAW